MHKKRYKPKVGQILFSLNINNSARNREQVLTPVEVKQVGNKYFDCLPVGREDNKWSRTKFEIDTWIEKSDYCRNEALYESASDWADEVENGKLIEEIRGFFGIYGHKSISTESLRAIRSLLPNV